MFLGFRNSSGSCSDYVGALRLYEKASKTPTGRPRTEKRHGFPMAGSKGEQRMVRKDETGAIYMRLYNTDVVVWHSPTKVEIDATYQTKTTGEFASALSPFSVGASGEITFFRPERVGDGWREVWAGSRIVRGAVVFDLVDDAWTPDVTTCEAFRTYSVDRKLSREVSATYHLADFKTWLSMAPLHIDGLKYEAYDPDVCAAALKARDFKAAAVLLPLVDDTSSYGIRPKALNIECVSGGLVTMGSLERLRLWLCDQHDAVVVQTSHVMTRRDLDAGKKRNAALCKAGVYDQLGWR